ncbi:MAG TPA: hypothetical protein VHO29_08355 [Marmoricola sp.]|nr:hypothetical protein [Marmoricola sp.]
MADDQDVPEEGSVPQTPEPAVAPTPKTRWRDRAWSFRAMLAVAAASLVIGGVAGGVIGAAAGGDDHGRYRTGPWGPGMHMGPGWRNGGPGFNGPGGPGWRWKDGQQPGQPPTPYGTPTPSAPSTPGSTG